MSKKAKKQVVPTQCLAHHIFLEICIPKSSLAHKYTVLQTIYHSMHGRSCFIYSYTLEEHVVWLAED